MSTEELKLKTRQLREKYFVFADLREKQWRSGARARSNTGSSEAGRQAEQQMRGVRSARPELERGPGEEGGNTRY